LRSPVRRGLKGDERRDGEMKELFAEREWEYLKCLPFAVYTKVAGADGVIDSKETLALNKVVAGAASQSELLNELYQEIASSEIYGLPNEWLSLNTMRLQLDSLKAVVRQKAGEEEYKRFALGLCRLGINIAAASGGFLGFGDKVCGQEREALTDLAEMLDLDPSEIWSTQEAF
jgi:hypothetical protein